MTSKPFRCAALLCISTALVACSSSQERVNYADLAQQEFERTEVQANQWQSLDQAGEISYLTDLIQSDELNQLIKEALAANPSLQKTALTLQASLWELKKSHGANLPSVDASVGVNEEKDSDTSYSAKISVSWELDLWQKLANAESASAKSLASDEALYQSSQDTLVASVMKTWLSLTAKQHAIEIETKRLNLLEANEQLIVKRFKSGLDNLEALDEARTSTSQSRASLAQYRENLEIQKRELQTLLGRNTPLILSPQQAYPEVSYSLSGLPEQNLQRRPDLKSAYLTIEAADLNTQVAYKDMLPSISLSAALSDAAESPRMALFTSPIWSLAAQLTQPLYQGGQLKAAAEVAKLQTAQAFQGYRDTLLTAVNEVEDALGQEKVLQQRLTHIRNALQSSRSNLTQYETKYRNGLVELSDLISAQTTMFDLEAQLDELIYEHLANRITLGLALGLGVKPE
ncbi:TolC family protein [Marinomonas sp. TW1]|uniref:TolC family protein n=1 Tax=Marinomonas sp. TW1 TaxID=1561203 RepID=UPI0007AFBB20|nr:TolC family protein [Marinomonas sp. TW1]KZN14055.1 RND transporter [Marinomonas sp. TW1]